MATMENMLLIYDDIDFYDVDELFEDISDVVLDLLERKEYEVEDLEKLQEMKKNAYRLVEIVEEKIEQVYGKRLEDF